MRNRGSTEVSATTCLVTMAGFVLGLVLLAVRLATLQINDAPYYSLEKDRQSIRRVQTAGLRGRILDVRGRVLAGNRICQSIICEPTFFQRKSPKATVAAIAAAVERVAAVIHQKVPIETTEIARHVSTTLSMPLYVWRDIGDEVLARFAEHAAQLEGFSIVETEERIYPDGILAPHIIGYVGRDFGDAPAGDVKFSFYESEMRGRAGVEYYYDSYLRGVPGERELLVDARGFARGWRTVTQGGRGPDLTLTLDADIQRVVREQFVDQRGACVVLDPRDGAIRAMVSAPDFDLNTLVPTMSAQLYARMSGDPAKPFLNRATAGSYAPGSTFKPITALTGLGAGRKATEPYYCSGVFEFGGMHIHCARRWGHHYLNMREALRDSCNAFFCNLGCTVGTNRLCRSARAMGLGARTGIDTPDEVSGVVPDHAWKMRTYGERWYPGDLPQMSIGQGMLLVTPLQMARMVGAIGTGRLATPRLRADAPSVVKPLPFPADHLRIVREGMRMVVEEGGTGVRGAKGIDAWVIGKTGTAEVGRGENRRKNTWFIAYAENWDVQENGQRVRAKKPSCAIAVALVVENGMSGGGTSAPRVREVLKAIFGETNG